MNLPKIVIINPVNSIYFDPLYNILKKMNCEIVHKKYLGKLKKITVLSPDLIFTFFGNSPVYEACKLLDEISIEFKSVPIIGLLNTGDCCDNCLILKNKLWGLVETPFRESDIVYFMQKLFNNVNDLSEAAIENILKKQIKDELLIGKSQEIKKIKKKISQVAAFNVKILIKGESGTGKELCAKMIHYLSSRSKRQFVPINCGAIPDELFENELFGHKKGAYTSAPMFRKLALLRLLTAVLSFWMKWSPYQINHRSNC